MYPKRLTQKVICDPASAIVETKAGKVRGLVTEGTYIFRGIKYADAKRFEEPKPVQPWEGVKRAHAFGPVSPEISTVIAHDAYYVPHIHWTQDEDCQYLNVWTQNPEAGRKRPVMVWIHGGGFATGSSIELFAYDGEELSKYGDVVVVSINHRLNIIGYLDLYYYGEKYKNSGNLGNMDMVAALQWVHDNIENFGGDPDNVMIMGQSGGGGKVKSLLQTPAADGLFHKASIQSGLGWVGEGGRGERTHESNKEFTDKLVAKLGLTKDTIEKIETIPYYKLARAAYDLGSGMNWGPVYDGEYYMGEPIIHGFREETKNIPVLAGSLFGEFANNHVFQPYEGNKNEWSDEQVEKLLSDLFGDKKDAAVEAFKKAYPEKKVVDLAFLEASFRRGTVQYCEARSKVPGAAPIYNWLIPTEFPYDGGTVGWHNADEAYMFHNAQYLEASYIPGVSEKMQDEMTGAWLAMAKTGDPNFEGLTTKWPSYQEEPGATYFFDAESYVKHDHDKEVMEYAKDVRRSMSGMFGGVFGGGPRQSL